MFCKIVTSVFAIAYALALLVFLTGTFGWFGEETDPLSGIFLVPLGLPWILIEVPDPARMVVAILAPVLNLILIMVLCRMRRRTSD